jgi:hypothetical protein
LSNTIVLTAFNLFNMLIIRLDAWSKLCRDILKSDQCLLWVSEFLKWVFCKLVDNWCLKDWIVKNILEINGTVQKTIKTIKL